MKRLFDNLIWGALFAGIIAVFVGAIGLTIAVEVGKAVALWKWIFQ